MRAVVTRVLEADVRVDGEEVARIGRGLLVLLGVAEGDDTGDAAALAKKVANLRIFPDDHRPLNRSILETGGEVLVVSQFTLLADSSRGRRPSFVRAAPPEAAEPLCREFARSIEAFGLPVRTGRFGARMLVGSVNEGPVTLLLTSRKEDRL